MLATFCIRVAFGLLACLLLLSAKQLHPRFFRTHFLTALGISIVAAMMAWTDAEWPLRWLLISNCVLTLLGALSWTLDPAPVGRILILASMAAQLASLYFLEPPSKPEWPGILPPILWAGNGASSAMLLGTTLTAMLVGHSYLISPGMSLQPLLRTIQAGAIALVIRIVIAACGLWRWTELTPTYTLNNEVVLWLPIRWVVGLAAPPGFGCMAYSATRIRSTQSATGILYVVVICVFLGELLSLLISQQTGLPL